jgi:hypothetical protein
MTIIGPGIVYLLCLLTSIACAALLVRGYRRTRTRLLMWSAAAFVLLALNNLFVVMDMVVFPQSDFSIARQGAAFSAVAVLLYGFIWEMD